MLEELPARCSKDGRAPARPRANPKFHPTSHPANSFLLWSVSALAVTVLAPKGPRPSCPTAAGPAQPGTLSECPASPGGRRDSGEDISALLVSQDPRSPHKTHWNICFSSLLFPLAGDESSPALFTGMFPQMNISCLAPAFVEGSFMFSCSPWESCSIWLRFPFNGNPC